VLGLGVGVKGCVGEITFPASTDVVSLIRLLLGPSLTLLFWLLLFYLGFLDFPLLLRWVLG
jgi:hypothetical protein